MMLVRDRCTSVFMLMHHSAQSLMHEGADADDADADADADDADTGRASLPTSR